MAEAPTPEEAARIQADMADRVAPPETLTQANALVAALLGHAVINPVLFDRVYEGVLLNIREGRAADPMSCILRRMAEEVHYWREVATVHLGQVQSRYVALKDAGAGQEGESPGYEADREMRNATQTLRDALDYTFLSVCEPTGNPIRLGDPVIHYEDVGEAHAPPGAKVGDRIDLQPDEIPEQQEGDEPHPGYIIVFGHDDLYTTQQMRTKLEEAEALLPKSGEALAPEGEPSLDPDE